MCIVSHKLTVQGTVQFLKQFTLTIWTSATRTQFVNVSVINKILHSIQEKKYWIYICLSNDCKTNKKKLAKTRLIITHVYRRIFIRYLYNICKRSVILYRIILSPFELFGLNRTKFFLKKRNAIFLLFQKLFVFKLKMLRKFCQKLFFFNEYFE